MVVDRFIKTVRFISIESFWIFEYLVKVFVENVLKLYEVLLEIF